MLETGLHKKAVLVAVSIPIFTSQLEKSRESTDAANLRAAKTAAVTAYLNADESLGLNNIPDDGVTLYYDANKGILVGGTSAPTSGFNYGKGTAATTAADDTVIFTDA